jgi:hypothetical protein
MAKSGKVIQTGQFVVVQVSDFAAEYGVKKKDLLYIAGEGMYPVSEEDPYAYRRVLLCAKVDKDGSVLAEDGCITIDGLKLKPVTKPRQDRLYAKFEEDFKLEVDDEASA